MIKQPRWWVLAAAILAGWALALLGCFHRIPQDQKIYQYAPPHYYQQWLDQAQNCVLGVRSLDSSFQIERVLRSPEEVTWFAVPTERPDGMFVYMEHRFNGLRKGPVGQDTILLSGQQLDNPRLVKHELMHVIVNSPTESRPNHQSPWGLCEY